MIHFELQPTLKNELIKLEPLKEKDFETLYSIASDPEIWEQHPNKDRYKRLVFETFFKGAMESKAAFLVYDAQTNVPIGSSRYYNFDYDFVCEDFIVATILQNIQIRRCH